MLEISLLRKFRKSVSTLPRFLHRGIAGNMQPLAGGEVRMICWVLVGFRLRKFFFEKSSVSVSKIDDFRHLGVEWATEGMIPDDYALTTTWLTPEISLIRNFHKVFPLCLDFYIKGQRAIWSRWQEVTLACFAGWSMDVDTHEKVFQKNFRKRFPKSSILDIRWCLTCWKIFWRWCHSARIFT